jgi:hypothetical protein
MIYYISPIGPVPAPGGRTGTGATLSQYGVAYTTVIPTYQQGDSIPAGKKVGDVIFTWALCAVPDGSNTAAIDADTSIDKVPITSLDVTINSLTQAQKSALQAIGTKYGITKIAGLKNSDTCRTALTDIGQTLDPNFDPGTFAIIP